MRVCILGATGLVGRELLHLVPRAWPGARLALYASRDQHLEVEGRHFEVAAAYHLDATDAPAGDLAFVALDDEHSARYVPRLLALGYRVVDKSNAYRADPAVPLVVAGVNDGLVDADVRLVANPNCTTIPLTLALAPLRRRFGLRGLAVATYQAVSGAGIAALDQFLLDAKVGYGAQDRLGLAFSPAGYAGNTVPHNAKTDASGYSSEERKLMTETCKILAFPGLPISAQCCRVPVAVGHYEQVWLSCEEPVSPAAALEAWQEAPFLRVVTTPDGAGLSALACVHERDLALVGRARPDPRDPAGLCFTVAADNLRLGAATNAVRIAARWFPVADPTLQAPGNMP
ncbi:MAG TPA: aspartate-semialdehyde dehydrogenase [Nannocystis sp.]